MSFDITDHVPGVPDDQVDAMRAEAEEGYDLRALPTEPNPHHGVLAHVPDELRQAVEERAKQDGSSTDDVVLAALTSYLHSA